MRNDSFGIVLDRPKTPENIASCLRTAVCYGASFLAIVGDRTIGKRGVRSPMNVFKTERRIPVLSFPRWDDYFGALSPSSWPLIGIEVDGQESLPLFQHHFGRSVVYAFGPEDSFLSRFAKDRAQYTISIPTEACLNLAICCATVLYDRTAKGTTK